MSTRSGRAYKAEVREMSIEEREGGPRPDSMSDLVRLLLEDRMHRDEEASQREKDRREDMDLLRSLVESSRPTTLSAGGAGEEGAARTVPAQEKVVLAKFTEGDDVDVFLTTFERVMNGYKIPEGRWAIQLAPQLSGKAQQAYASLSAEAAANYQEVKKAILRRYDVCEEPTGNASVLRGRGSKRHTRGLQTGWETLLASGWPSVIRCQVLSRRC